MAHMIKICEPTSLDLMHIKQKAGLAWANTTRLKNGFIRIVSVRGVVNFHIKGCQKPSVDFCHHLDTMGK